MPKIVNVNITGQLAVATGGDFGKILIFTKAQDFTYKEYDVSGGLTDLLDDFANTTDVYKIANSAVSQNPRPSTIAVAGKSFTEETAITNETLTQEGATNTYNFANSNIKLESISGLEDNNVAIPDSDIESIDYEAGTITFATSKTSVTVDDYVYFNALTTITAELDEVVAINDSWRLLVTDFSLENYRALKEIATWVESKEKVFVGQSNLEEFPVDVTPFSKTIPIYSGRAIDSNERLEGATVGYLGGNTPGTYTLAHKQLLGITPDALTDSQQLNLIGNAFTGTRGKGLNIFVRQNGLNMFFWGYAGTGFIDAELFEQFLAEQLTVAIVTRLSSTGKIPFSNSGISIIAGIVFNTANRFVGAGIDAGSITVTSKTIQQLPAEDRANRRLSGIVLSYRQDGAIHTVSIDGIATV